MIANLNDKIETQVSPNKFFYEQLKKYEKLIRFVPFLKKKLHRYCWNGLQLEVLEIQYKNVSGKLMLLSNNFSDNITIPQQGYH